MTLLEVAQKVRMHDVSEWDRYRAIKRLARAGALGALTWGGEAIDPAIWPWWHRATRDVTVEIAARDNVRRLIRDEIKKMQEEGIL